MTRRCSHCSNNGHNSRTCPGRAGGVRLFGVQLAEGMGAMKKSASMGCLPSSSSSSCSALSTVVGAASPSPAVAAAASPSGDQLGDYNHAAAAASPSGYVSDDPARASCSSNCRSERKKGVPWTEEEHRMFLMGLQKLGKGNWRGIARNFVVSRTPTQVASHAQKYFIRQSNASRRKRRSSLFDMVPEMLITDAVPAHEEQFLLHSPPNELESSMPVPIPFWPSNLTTAADEKKMEEAHKIIVKPTPVIPKEPVNVDEVVGMAKLSIGEPPALSLKLLGSSSSRQSAFQINPSIAVPDLNQSNSSPIHAV